jgi:hypothetical protein
VSSKESDREGVAAVKLPRHPTRQQTHSMHSLKLKAKNGLNAINCESFLINGSESRLGVEVGGCRSTVIDSVCMSDYHR